MPIVRSRLSLGATPRTRIGLARLRLWRLYRFLGEALTAGYLLRTGFEKDRALRFVLERILIVWLSKNLILGRIPVRPSRGSGKGTGRADAARVDVTISEC